jgi:hypothetical protein
MKTLGSSGTSAPRPGLSCLHDDRPWGRCHGRHHGGAWDHQLQPLADLAKFIISDRFPPREPDVAAYQRPWVKESDPTPPLVAVATDDIAATAEMQANRCAVVGCLGHYT